VTVRVPLKRVARLMYGDALAADQRIDGDYPVMGSGGMVGTHKYRNFRAPGIVIGRKGSYGSVHWAPDGGFAIDTAYYIDETCTSADLRWLYFALQAVDLRGVSQDVGVPGLSRESAYEISIPVPSLEEQRRIADFLDAETGRIDRLVQARMRQRVALDEHAYADISETLIPGITRKPAGVWPWVWLPELGKDRPLVRLGYVCRIQTGITVDSGRDVGSDPVTRPYLRVANVQAGHIDLSSVAEVTVPRALAARSTLRPGDVLMTEGGDLDKLGRGTVWRGELPDCLHQNHVFALRPEPDRLDAEYLALMTQTVHGRCYFESTGTKTTNLASTSSSKILSFPIPLPSVSRQRELVAAITRRLDMVARAKAELSRQLELLAERRQALITATVTGQLDISTASGRGVTDGVS